MALTSDIKSVTGHRYFHKLGCFGMLHRLVSAIFPQKYCAEDFMIFPTKLIVW